MIVRSSRGKMFKNLCFKINFYSPKQYDFWKVTGTRLVQNRTELEKDKTGAVTGQNRNWYNKTEFGLDGTDQSCLSPVPVPVPKFVQLSSALECNLKLALFSF